MVGGEPAEIVTIANEIAGGNLDRAIAIKDETATGIRASIEKMAGSLIENQIRIDNKTQLLKAINRIFRDAFTSETEEELAKTALSVAEELTGSGFGYIGEINEKGLFTVLTLSSAGWEACQIPVADANKFIRNMPLRGIDRTILKHGRSRIVNHEMFIEHPDRVGVPKGHPVISNFMGVPFRKQDQVVGMIGLANKVDDFTIQEQEAVEALAAAFYEALTKKRLEKQMAVQTELKTNQTRLADLMLGDQKIELLARNILNFLCKQLNLQTGLFYLPDQQGVFSPVATYACKRRKNISSYKPGEGLVGQAALGKEPIVITQVPEHYLTIESGLSKQEPLAILVMPLLYDGEVKAVAEFGSLKGFREEDLSFLESISESVALTMVSAENRMQLAKALEEAQTLTEELQSQQEELKVSNEELEEQTEQLKESQEKLKAQQEEMEANNEELEERNQLLQEQKRKIDTSRSLLEEKARELALASKYKSEFLANMSHELRTPLNSLLLLAQSLAENKAGNLSVDQMESADIIYSSGNDLLNLINEILDLSKIEAGRMDIQPAEIKIGELADILTGSFQHLAEEKKLTFATEIGKNVPTRIISDQKRVLQVLRNLVSNAIKFTEKGSVTVKFRLADPGSAVPETASPSGPFLMIEIVDTDIGVSPEFHQTVFEAFQQGDGGTSRKYGGTGLGLSISRELAKLLGGWISLQSRPGEGATFTLFLPVIWQEKAKETEPVLYISKQSPTILSLPVEDDREALHTKEKPILVIEDDVNFARLLYNKCHDKGFQCLVAYTGENGLELATEHDSLAILLDIRLPGIDGWTVLSALKENIQTRHIPVHIVSVDESYDRSMRQGAVGHAIKPLDMKKLEELFDRIQEVSKERPRHVLIVEDDKKIRAQTASLIRDRQVQVREVETGEEAMKALSEERFDCMVLDLKLPDMTGQELFQQLENNKISTPPVIVHTARNLTREEEAMLREHAELIIIKDVRSQERLLDEVSLFLHSVVSQMPKRKRQIISNLYNTDVLFKDKKVLIVDDDMRTTFALSKLLGEKGMMTLKAENGEKALRILNDHPDTAIVLLDIMMPGMDGYETLVHIRNDERFRSLPVIVLTAKAMQEDREKCLNVGANDYMTKPIESERLISMMRIWLNR